MPFLNTIVFLFSCQLIALDFFSTLLVMHLFVVDRRLCFNDGYISSKCYTCWQILTLCTMFDRHSQRSRTKDCQHTGNCYHCYQRHCRGVFLLYFVTCTAPSHLGLCILILVLMQNLVFSIGQAFLGLHFLGNFLVVSVVMLCSSLFLQHLFLLCSCMDREASFPAYQGRACREVTRSGSNFECSFCLCISQCCESLLALSSVLNSALFGLHQLWIQGKSNK